MGLNSIALCIALVASLTTRCELGMGEDLREDMRFFLARHDVIVWSLNILLMWILHII